MTLRLLVTPEVIETMFTRDHLGNRLRVDWGEPDPDGFHTPTITVDYGDNIVAAERAHWHRTPGAYRTEQGTEIVVDVPESASFLADEFPDEVNAIVAAERARIGPFMDTIKEALRIGAICFEGDSWFVSRDALGDTGYDLDDAEKILDDARAAVLAIIEGA